ncbi:MAG: HmuY family protein [Gemmatimonadota bacterium]
MTSAPRRWIARRVVATGAIAMAVTLTACEDEITDPGDSVVQGQLTIDASNPALFTYVTFAYGGSAVAVTDPATSEEWDLAFRRFSGKLNGGVAGPGSVAGANLMNNGAATDTEVTQFTLTDADAAWEAVTEADIAGATFIEDGILEDESGPWFRFDPISQNLVANPGAAWKVREGEGGYAIIRIAELVMDGQTPESVTIEYRRQDSAGGAMGDLSTIDVNLTMGPAFIDLSSGSVGAPIACGWDLSITFFAIDFNTDCNAGTFPLDAAEDFTSVASAGDAPEYGPFLSVVSGAFPTTVGDAEGIFWYNIEGNNRLWPTFNVFLVRVGTAVYKVQITGYYNSSGESGFPTMRFEQLR